MFKLASFAGVFVCAIALALVFHPLVFGAFVFWPRLVFASLIILVLLLMIVAALHKPFRRVVVLFGALGLGAAIVPLAGCAGTGTSVTGAITSANNALATLASNDIPTACTIISVAQGYFANVKTLVPASAVSAEAKAAAIIAPICANPPSNVASVFGILMTEWTIIQSSTTVPSSN